MPAATTGSGTSDTLGSFEMARCPSTKDIVHYVLMSIEDLGYLGCAKGSCATKDAIIQIIVGGYN